MKFNASRKTCTNGRLAYIDVETKFPWGKLTKSTKSKNKKPVHLRPYIATAIYGIGAPEMICPRVKSTQRLKTEAGNFYKTRTDAYKFAAAYLDIYRTNNGGRASPVQNAALHCTITPFSGRTVYIRQACLANTAYDTRRQTFEVSSGDLSAVASTASTPESLTVHPAGSNVASLNFTYQDKVLVPSPETKHTLSSYGCADGLQIFTRGVGAMRQIKHWGTARPWLSRLKI